MQAPEIAVSNGKCDSPFSFWSPNVSPRKPFPQQHQCNNTGPGRNLDRTQSSSKIPFPLEKLPTYTCSSTKPGTRPPTKEPCCQHAAAQAAPKPVKVPGGGGFKGVTHCHNKHNKVIPIKTLPKPGEGLVTTKYAKTCNDCKKYEADKAKPIEKLIADTKKNAKLCAECECHSKDVEAHYMKATGHERNPNPTPNPNSSPKSSPPPPPGNCCTENCVGKRVYSKPPLGNAKKKQVPAAVRLMDWPWYWSRYFPTAASRVAKRIIQAKVDAQNAKLHPQPVAEFEVCFLSPPPPKPSEQAVDKAEEKAGEKTVGKTVEKPAGKSVGKTAGKASERCVLGEIK